MEKQHIESLLIKSFTGKSEIEEQQIIRQWLNESDENKKEFAAYQKLWEDSRSLMLSDSIDPENALVKTKRRIPEFGKELRLVSFLRQAAAVLALSAALSVTMNYFMDRKPAETGELVYQEIKAAFGTQTKLMLADGTAVWLNSGSTLKFPLSFDQADSRQVTLMGEGYFEVTKNPEKPFIVNTSRLDVKVLGTSFNINAYEDERHIEVALITGKVEIFKQLKDGQAPLMTLRDSEVADYDSDNNKMVYKTEADINRYTAWKDGKIVFFDDPVEKLVSRLENWYNVDIEIADQRLESYHFTATFSQESLDQVLKYLTISTPFQYQFIHPPKTGDQTESRTKVILF